MLEPITSNLPSWLLLAAALVGAGGFGGLTTALVTIWLNRNRPKAEIHETESRAELNNSEAELNRASARNIDFKDTLSLGVVVRQLIGKSVLLETRVVDLVAKNVELQEERHAQDEIITRQGIEIEAYERQKMLATATKLLEGTHGK